MGSDDDSDSDSGRPFRMRLANDGYDTNDEGVNVLGALGAGVVLGVLAGDKLRNFVVRRFRRRKGRRARRDRLLSVPSMNSVSWDQFSMSELEGSSQSDLFYREGNEKLQLPLSDVNATETSHSCGIEHKSQHFDTSNCNNGACRACVEHEKWGKGTKSMAQLCSHRLATEPLSEQSCCTLTTVSQVGHMVYTRVGGIGVSAKSEIVETEAYSRRGVAKATVGSSWGCQRRPSGLVDLLH